MLNIPAMAAVYSYARFSTPEQASGDSLRRQTAAAEKWAQDRGMVLDDRLSLTDEGVSSYRGANAAEDRGLGSFLYACQQGLIERGSYLLVESLDRLSRMDPFDAQQQFMAIVGAGVTIVTLQDGQEFSRQRMTAEPWSFLVAYMVAMRAHEESATKGRRVAAAWAAKRERMRTGKDARLTMRAPGWVQWDATANRWDLQPVHAATVRRVFELTDAGWGEHRIAEAFNREGVPLMGRGAMWHRSAVSKILGNVSAIGQLVPGRIEHVEGKRRRVMEEPIDGVFPPAVDIDLWRTVRALKDGTAAAPRGRHAGAVSHMLAGLARCPACGSAMTRVSKGSRAKAGKPKLVCTRAKVGAGCSYVAVPVEEVEAAILRDWGALGIEVPAGDDTGPLGEQLWNLRAAIAGVEDHLTSANEDYRRKPSFSLAQQMSEREAELRTMVGLLADLEERRAQADHGLIDARLEALHEVMSAEDGPEPAAVNRALRALFSGVVVDYREGRVRFLWRQGGETGIIYRWMHG
ncbi:MAG: recombinase family protein [Sandaracinobacter sp.]